jgi:predicted transcriptional regulator
MKVKDIVKILEGKVLSGEDKMEREVKFVGAADMMSDVLALSKPDMIILTGHTSLQAIRTAIVTDLLGLVFVRGKEIPEKTIEMAREANLLLIHTNTYMYAACGKLYSAGLRGLDERR